jgi:hypothetical protein
MLPTGLWTWTDYFNKKYEQDLSKKTVRKIPREKHREDNIKMDNIHGLY